MTPHRLADALRGSTLGNDACRCLTVMALADGGLNTFKIERVVTFAEALQIHPDYVDELAQAASGDLRGALAHMVRDNMESSTGKPWAGGEMLAWMLPYGSSPMRPWRRVSGHLKHCRKIALDAPGLSTSIATATRCPARRLRSMPYSPFLTTPRTSFQGTRHPRAARSSLPPSPPECIRTTLSPDTSCR